MPHYKEVPVHRARERVFQRPHPEHAVDLGRGGDDAHAQRITDGLAAHQPVLGDGEVVGAVDVFEGLDLVLRTEEEFGGVRAALRELDEGAFGVPAKERSRARFYSRF